MLKLLIVLATIITVLAVVVIIRTFTYPFQEQVLVAPVERREVDADAAASHLAEAVRFQTISHQKTADNDANEILAFHRWLEETYPAAHLVLKREIVNEHSLLYTWEGEDPSLEPVIFLAHMDVVPVDQNSESKWTEPPFGGVISDGFIWGRGTLDMKGILVAIMEAVELQVAGGHQPQRTILLGFGHDEEVGGRNGAAKIAELLKSRGVRLQWIIDEGSVITRGIIPGTDRPVALVGIAEKGYLTLELIAKGAGGHSSMPPYDMAVTRLARAITKLQQNPFPGRIEGAVSEMLDALGSEFPFAARAVVANQWLFGPLIDKTLSWRYRTGAVGSKELNALLRTTIAHTMLRGSPKENVLPTQARATVNFRIHPRDSVESVLEHVRSLIDDLNVSVKIASSFAGGRNPTPVSATDSEGYKTIKRTTQEVFPEATVVPALVVVGGTDSGHYADMAEGVYRFGPFVLGSEDLEGIHGIDERISVDGFAAAVRFYIRLIDNIDG